MATRARVARLGLLGLGLLLGLLLCELGIRAIAPQWSDQWKMWRLDPVYARGLRPGVRDAVVHGHSGEFAFRFSTNQSGLRMDHELPPAPSPGRPRVLFVGDSFTFGYGVEQGQSFPNRLEDALRGLGKRIESVNAGFASGFTLDTEYLFTREVASSWKPDRVVVGVCLSNDLSDLDLTRWRVSDGELVALAKRDDWLPHWLRKSALVNLLVKGVAPEIRRLSGSAGTSTEVLESPCRLAAEKLHERVTSPPAAPPSAAPPPASIETGNDRATRSPSPSHSPRPKIDWIQRAWAGHADRSGYELTILLIPDAEEVQWPTSPGRLGRRASTRALFSEAARLHSIEVLDPLAAMRGHVCATDEPLYYDVDGHWNAAGHRFVSEWLAHELFATEPR